MVKEKQTGKKYLLYIHHPAFSVEKHKSALVERLLREHYNPEQSGTVYTIDPKVAKENAQKRIHDANEKLAEEGLVKLKKIRTVMGICEHGKELKMCMVSWCENYANK